MHEQRDLVELRGINYAATRKFSIGQPRMDQHLSHEKKRKKGVFPPSFAKKGGEKKGPENKKSDRRPSTKRSLLTSAGAVGFRLVVPDLRARDRHVDGAFAQVMILMNQFH